MSSLPWSSEIPSHWQVVPARAVAQAVKREPGPDDMTVTAFRDGQVTLRSNRRTDGFTESVKDIGYQGVRNGEVVIHSMDAFAGAIGVSDSNGKMSPVVHIYTTPEDNPEYVVHSLRAASRAGFIRALAKGIRERSTSFDRSVFKSMLLPRPPRVEQDEIVEFLDCETRRIDELIAEQRGLIETLQERRVSTTYRLINGLDIDVERLNSDSLVFPHLPASWGAVPLGLIGKSRSGSGFPPSLQGTEGESLPFFKVKHLASADSKGAMHKADDTVSLETAKLLRAIVFPPDTIAYAKVGAALMLGRIRTLGRAGCLDNNMAGFIPSHAVDSRFVQLAMSLIPFEYLVNPGAVPSLSDKNLMAMKIPLPSLGEQVAIAAEIDDQTSRIDALIAESEDLIALSQERRAALITAAVTGQIDVRAAA